MREAHPGFWTISLSVRTASSLVMFSKLTSFTYTRTHSHIRHIVLLYRNTHPIIQTHKALKERLLKKKKPTLWASSLHVPLYTCTCTCTCSLNMTEHRTVSTDLQEHVSWLPPCHQQPTAPPAETNTVTPPTTHTMYQLHTSKHAGNYISSVWSRTSSCPNVFGSFPPHCTSRLPPPPLHSSPPHPSQPLTLSSQSQRRCLPLHPHWSGPHNADTKGS